MKKTPNALEFDGFYNVESGKDDLDYQDSFLIVKPGLGSPTVREINKLTNVIQKTMKASGVEPDLLYFDLGFNDRTAKVAFQDPSDLTMTRLESLQAILKSKFENWRIAVIGNSPASTIILYPTEIVFPRNEDKTEQLRQIRDELIREIDATEGAFQRQVEYVGKLIKSRQKELESLQGAPLIIAVFDNYRGDRNSLCVWIVNSGDRTRSAYRLPDENLGDGFKGTAGANAWFDVTDQGELVEAMTAEERYRGRTFAIIYNKKQNQGEIYMVSTSDGSKISLPISHMPILSDADVKSSTSVMQ